MKAIKQHATQKGFTLIELLLALALGAFVVAISIALYQHAKKAYVENGTQLLNTKKVIISQRFFKEGLAGSIESCNNAPIRLSLVDSSQLWWQAGASVAEIYPAHNNIQSFKEVGSQIGERDANSDVLLLRPALLPATSIVKHDIENDKFIAQNSIQLTRGGLAIVCDQNVAVVFQVAYTTGRHIHYGSGDITPGNCRRAFNAENCGGDYRFDKDALLAHYTPKIFYIANSYAGPALYRQQPIISRRGYSHRLSMHSQELVSGIIGLHGATAQTDNGHSSGLVLQITIAGNTSTKSEHYEKYLYTLPL